MNNFELYEKLEVISKLIYAIGDIHGCKNSLEKLVKKVSPQSKDTMIFLGDYIDRGPDSKGVIEFLINFLRTHPNTVFLKGNHEWMFYEFYKTRDPDMWRLWEINGANLTLKNYGNIENIPKEHVEFVKNTKIYHIQDGYFFVHAGVKPNKPIEEQRSEDMLWIREEFIYSDNPLKDHIVVFGHTPMKKPLIMSDKIGIDTGCIYGGYLTCICLDDRKIFQERC